MLMLVSVLRMEAGVVINVPAVAGLTLSADNSESFTYDLNANLLTISRKGRDDAGSYRVVDEIEMGYIGNQLSWLRDTAEDPLLEGSMDIPQGNYSGYDIMYDGAGRVTRDVSRGISHVNYNVTGTPFVVGTMTADCAVYGYTSSGAKLSETIYNGSVTTRRDYVGPCEYVDGKLERVNVPQGYIDSLGVLHAYIHDIQGNVTGVYEAKAGKKQLEQLNEYYAYGGLTADSKGQDRNRYRHTGKELVSDLGINSYDFTARWQYPMAGAFTSPDAKAIDYKWLSPYSFCGGDPINGSDPTGMDTFVDEKGKVLGKDGSSTNYLWVIRTTNKNYGQGANRVKGANLSEAEKNTAIDFVTANSGNNEAFLNNQGVYDAFMNTHLTPEGVYNINKYIKDSGLDHTLTEHSGCIKDSESMEVTNKHSGTQFSEGTGMEVATNTAGGEVSFHTHPTGIQVDTHSSSSATTIGKAPNNISFIQHPSKVDLQGGVGKVNIVISIKNNRMYFYLPSKNRVEAEVRMTSFTKIKN